MSMFCGWPIIYCYIPKKNKPNETLNLADSLPQKQNPTSPGIQLWNHILHPANLSRI